MSTQALPNTYGQSGYGQGGYGGTGGPFSLPIEYYAGLITSQYRQSVKMLAWMRANLQLFQDVAFCLYNIPQALDPDTATGACLDLLGVYVGVSRTVGFQPSNGVSPVLDDDTYRILLKARIAQNYWGGKLTSLQGAWRSLFPGGRIAIDDAQNMTATVILSGAFTSIIKDLITNGYIVPRPQGVLYNYSFATLPIFGADRDDAFVAGADTGHAV